MKRILFIFTFSAFCVFTSASAADDAATQERLDKLAGQLKDLTEAHEVIQKKIAELAKEVSSVREQLTSSSGNVVSQDDFKRLATEIEKVDQKRAADNERIIGQIESLGKAVNSAIVAPPTRSHSEETVTLVPSEKGFEYTVKHGDVFDLILIAFRKDKGISVKKKDVLAANPGLNPDKIIAGQKIFIPFPKP